MRRGMSFNGYFYRSRSRFMVVGLLGLTLFAGEARGQATRGAGERVDILHSDNFMMDTRRNVTRLVGNVRLRHEGMLMWCDSLHQYQDSNYLEAFGRVRAVRNDTVEMRGEYMFYDANTRMAKVRRNVTLRDPRMTLTTNYLDYDGVFEIGHYFNGGRLRDSVNTLDSREGRYFTRTGMALFRDSVRVVSPDYRIRSDTMRYSSETGVAWFLGPTWMAGVEDEGNRLYTEDGWYDSGRGHAELYRNNRVWHGTYRGVADSMTVDSLQGVAELRGGVDLVDSVNQMVVRGEYCWMDRERDEAFVTERALLIVAGRGDSLYLHSDSLFMERDSAGQQVMRGHRHTRFYSRDLQGQCDTVKYTAADSVITLTGEPVAWASGYQMTAERMRVLTGRGSVKEFYLEAKAMMVGQRDTVAGDSGWMFDQIKGRNMTGYFRDNELYMVYVDGSGETIYFPDDQGVIIGVNRATSSNIRIMIKERKVQEIVFLNKPEGEMTPLFLAWPEETRLKDFQWLKYLQPRSKEDIFEVPPAPEGKKEEGEGEADEGEEVL